MERKYAGFIAFEGKPPPVDDEVRSAMEKLWEKGLKLRTGHLFRIESDVIPGCFYVDCVWIFGKEGEGPLYMEPAHKHDFDELLGLIGSDESDPKVLGAEVEFWIEDEKYYIDRSCIIFIPKGVVHCPMYIHSVTKPFFFFTMGNTPHYARTKV
ncbi:MAG: hypothetical protein ABIM21_02755 [candidate division WOR-3 bacterium]